MNAYPAAMWVRLLMAIGVLCASGLAHGYADEERDWGVPATRDIRPAPYSAPTPKDIPGGRLIHTDELKALLATQPVPLLIDVAGGEGNHLSLAGAIWLPRVGRGVHYVDPLQAELAERLDTLTQGDKARPLVFFCVNAHCWLSYNASLRAAALGYSRVFWYRGGIQSWREAGLPVESITSARP